MSSSATSSASAKENLRATLIIFFGIVTGVFVFMLIAIFMNQANGPLIPGLDKYHTIITWGAGAFSLVCLVVGRQVLRKGTAAAKNSLNPLQDKLSQYRSSLIRYLAICEVPASLGVILFMLTGNFVFQLFSAVFLGFMLAVAPIRRRVVAALELNGSEQRELE
jgi:hypothetical protein